MKRSSVIASPAMYEARNGHRTPDSEQQCPRPAFPTHPPPVHFIHCSRVPPGVFQIVNGTGSAAQALGDSPGIKALTFVGSSSVARSMATRCHATHKRVLALGGAQNHLVAIPDCE